MSDLLEQTINVVALVRGKIAVGDDIGPDDGEALIKIIERQHEQLVCVESERDAIQYGAAGIAFRLGWTDVCGKSVDDLAAETKARAEAAEAQLRAIIYANQSFRDSMPEGWEGDPLQDECEKAKVLLGMVPELFDDLRNLKGE